MKIVPVQPDSEILEDVILLGDANSATLGLFPRKAFGQKAKDGHIIAAADDGGTCGYLMYGYNWRSQVAYIVHLCVDKKRRGSGVAKRLFQEFERTVAGKVRGIRVHCRKDYKAQALWPRLGFHEVDERPGRSKHGSIITVWRKPTESPDLFDAAKDLKTPRIRAAIDYNILADSLKEVSDLTSGAHAIMEDWLAEVVDFFVTPETKNEARRDKESSRQARVLKRMRRFEKCSAPSEQFEDMKDRLKVLFGASCTSSDNPDTGC